MVNEWSGPGNDEHEAGVVEHHREVALFLSVHLNRTPGVLWPDFDHPVFGSEAGPAEFAVLAQGLSALTGLPVRTVPGADAGLGGLSATGVWHLLVHQCLGKGLWSVFPGAARSEMPALSYTLRAGEVLYVPPGRACEVERNPGSRCVVSYLGSSRSGCFCLPGSGLGLPGLDGGASIPAHHHHCPCCGCGCGCGAAPGL